ncbi:Rad4 beta-hairpin domain 1 [Penicillium concentricum]|uniref:Rad4 beta-hairpin domain 1 n=1 Tax=Penicillium concentricum TaxID=293559 RepID=A0A9W9SSJ2_9EURO|nr:Rad4 beta-hairpin domain 1 [Penicillium concentricum]KAJ5383837.1 Rad4 beta-hairpin domain 1 [Penicillium concentricum]
MVRQTQARSTRSRATPAGQLKRQRQTDDQAPDVYQELLEEAEARDPEHFASDRPIKRRKAGDMKAIPVGLGVLEQTHRGAEANKPSTQPVQTVYDSSTSEESDVDWEDVELQQPPQSLLNRHLASQGDDEVLQITLEQEPEKHKKAVQRRKPLNGAERKARLDVHKCHILCLLGHVQLRNMWCNDEELQEFLKKTLPRKVIALLHPDEGKPHYSRSTTFMDGLNQAGDAFTRRFRVTKPGMKRAHWAEDESQLKQKMESIMSNAEVFLSKGDFRTQAKTMEGSRDFGAQLFCALLRSVAVEARLVCSLQPLPFSGTVKDMTPSKPKHQYIVISSDDPGSSTDERSKSEKSPAALRPRRIGQPKFTPSRPQPKFHSGLIPTSRDSSFPVVWVEAFNQAAQKWVPIDPVVTKSLAKPSKFEPPASDSLNLMNYVVAFEDDASARDVTRRYVKAFNAKTRKLRVEVTRNGEEWWEKALKAYEKPFFEDRDETEISELTSKSAAEPMPRNIQDFKDHPVYAIERHVHRNEVIHPKRIIGHVGLGKSTTRSEISEPVYRRSDVHIVRSSDKWYRLGRDVRVGEQPLKRVAASRNKGGGFSDDEEVDEPQETTLYAEFQTDIYVPPPVVEGRIPKNTYGNLDVYVPSMVPSGGVHIKRAEAVRAARILGIDYADAVTGFDFRGRRGTAVLGGIVIAVEYQEALEEVLRGLEDEKRHAALEARTAEALRVWRLFLMKLRIAERVREYASDDEEQQPEDIEDEVDAEDAGGGFFPEPDQPANSPPLDVPGKGKMTHDHHLPEDREMESPLEEEDYTLGGGFLPDDHDPAPDPVEPPKPARLATNPTSIPESIARNRALKTPRYSLMVVPNHSSTPTSVPQALAGSSDEVPISVGSSTNGGSKSASVVTISRPLSPVPNYDSDSEIEKGSLLSEDPEDEDAIPEWLMSDEG